MIRAVSDKNYHGLKKGTRLGTPSNGDSRNSGLAQTGAHLLRAKDPSRRAVFTAPA